MVPNLRIILFLWNFVLRQIRGCWFQIWQYLLTLSAQKYPNKVFLVPNLDIFVVFLQNFAFRQIWGCWFQISQQFFQILAQKYPSKAFLVPNLETFFGEILQLDKFEGAEFKYEDFQILARKYPNKAFLVSSLGIFVFFCFEKFCN